MKIFAVVVTYNRLALLKKVIDLLKRQTRQLSVVFITIEQPKLIRNIRV